MRRVPAILIVLFLACPLFFAALVTISVSTWALDRNFYLGLLSDERLYQVPDATTSATWGGAAIPGLEGISWRSVGRASKEIFTPAYLRGQALRILGDVFDTLEGRESVAELSIDFAPVKKALLGEPGKRFARMLAEDLPVGGAAADFQVKRSSLPHSRPASISVDRAASVIQAGLPELAKSIPDTYRIGDSGSFHFEGWRWERFPRFSVVGMLVFADVVLLLIAGGFWVAAGFIGGANTFERLQWLGWSLLAPALGVLAIGLLINMSVFWDWIRWGIETARLATQGFGEGFSAALLAAIRQAMMRVGTGFIATGAIAGGVAAGLLAGSWAMPKTARIEGKSEG
jgi:hypothetical protein